MTPVASPSPQSPLFSSSTRVPISHLNIEASTGVPSHIHAVVALVWPFSSSTRSLSLLLAEPDIRLRKSKGQVKVRFRETSAEAVARSRLGIGDTVRLALDGAQWVKSGEDVATPGKKIEWDLVFEGRANLDITRGSQHLVHLVVDEPVRTAPAIYQPLIPNDDGLRNGIGSTPTDHNGSSWSSPTFVNSRRLPSGSFLDASLDPFAADDGFVIGKGRKRTKFARHSDSWRLLDRSPSPRHEILRLSGGLEDVSADSMNIQSSPGAKPRTADVVLLQANPQEAGPLKISPEKVITASAPTEVRLRQHAYTAEFTEEESVPSVLEEQRAMQATMTSPKNVSEPPPSRVDALVEENISSSVSQSDFRTPRLTPLQSPGLPLVSPLTRRHGPSAEYFPKSWDNRSQLDASGDVEESLPPLAAGNLYPPVAEHLRSEDVLHKSRAGAQETSAMELSFDHFEPEPEDVGQLNEHLPLTEEPVPSPLRPESPDELTRGHDSTPREQVPPTNSEGSDFEFLNTSPIDMGDDHHAIWRVPEDSRTDKTTFDALVHGVIPRNTLPSPIEQSFALSDLSSGAALQQDVVSSPSVGRTASTTEDHPSLELAVVETGPPLSGAKPVEAHSEAPTQPSQDVPVDPNLFNENESATYASDGESTVPEMLPPSPRLESDPRPWHDKLEISAIESEYQQAYSEPPFPFQQHWHTRHGRRSSKRSRRSSRYGSMDGASDNLSDEVPFEQEPGTNSTISEVRQEEYPQVVAMDGAAGTDIPLQTSSPALQRSPSEIPNFPEMLFQEQAVQTTDISEVVVVSENAELGTRVEREVIVLDEEDEISENEVSVHSADNADVAAHMVRSRKRSKVPTRSASISILTGDTISQTAMAGGQKQQSLDTKTQPQMVIEEPQAAAAVPVDLVIPPKAIHQLETPDNTQQDAPASKTQEHGAPFSRELSLPYTPQNTQEPTYLSQSPVEGENAAEIDGRIPTTDVQLKSDIRDPRQQRRSPRLSRKISLGGGVSEVVSPYFAPRPTSRIQGPEQLRAKSEDAPVRRALMNDRDRPRLEAKDPGIRATITPDMAEASKSVQAGVKTPIAYYTPLSDLSDHLSQIVDVLAICTASSTGPQRAKSGPKDWHSTLHLADPSLAGSQPIATQLFRPYKMALPRTQNGDTILLRNVRVQSRNRKCMLVSTESSAWVAFRLHNERGGKVSRLDAVVAGPPIEYGQEEKGYASRLIEWWSLEGESLHTRAQERSLEHQSTENTGVATSYHELRDGTVYQDTVADETKDRVESRHKPRYSPGNGNDPMSVESTTTFLKSDHDPTVDGAGLVHELRNGSLYQDVPATNLSEHPPVYSSDITAKNKHTEKQTFDNTVAADEEGKQDGHFSPDAGGAALNREQMNEDNDEESETDQAVSSQLYHELRNGRRYVDPVPSSKETAEGPNQQEIEGDDSLVHELRDGVTWVDE